MDSRNKAHRDNLLVLFVFGLLALVMICVMIHDFNVLDLCYFFVIVYFGIRYLLLCKE